MLLSLSRDRCWRCVPLHPPRASRPLWCPMSHSRGRIHWIYPWIHGTDSSTPSHNSRVLLLDSFSSSLTPSIIVCFSLASVVVSFDTGAYAHPLSSATYFTKCSNYSKIIIVDCSDQSFMWVWPCSAKHWSTPPSVGANVLSMLLPSLSLGSNSQLNT